MDKTAYQIRFPEKAGYAAASLSHDLAAQFISTFLMFYLTDVLGISPMAAGTIWMLANVWDGVNDPLIGHYADNHRFKNGEKMRPFGIWFGVPFGVCLVLLFTAWDLSTWGKIIYVAAVYFLMESFSTCFKIPYYALYMLATDDRNQRANLKTYASFGTSLGVLLGAVLCWPMVEAFGGVAADGSIIDPQRGFFFAALIFAVIAVAGPLYNALTTRERVVPEKKEEHIALWSTLKLLAGYRNWRLNTIFTLLYSIGNLMVTTVLVYYSTYILSDSGAVTIIIVTFVVGSLVALPFVGPLSKRAGQKKTMMLAGVVYILCRIPVILFPYSLAAMLINVFFMGIGMSLSMIGFYTVLADCVDVIEWKSGRRIEGISATVSALLVKCAGSVAAFAIGIALEFAKYDGELAVQPKSAEAAILAFVSWIPLVVAVLLFITASRLLSTR